MQSSFCHDFIVELLGQHFNAALKALGKADELEEEPLEHVASNKL